MRAHAALLALALAVAAATACGPKPAPVRPPPGGGSGAPVGGTDAVTTAPSDPKDSLAAAVERNVVLLESIAMLPSTLSCKDAATRVDGLARERTADRAAVRAALTGDKSADVDAMYAEASGRLADAMVKIDALAGRCAADAELTAALGRLSTEGP